MLLKVGGVSIEFEILVVIVKCGSVSGKVWLCDLYFNLCNDIVLCLGDIILVEEDQCSFIVLGVFGGQIKVLLGNESINVIEVVVMVGGLLIMLVDFKGVFVLCDEL